MNPISRRVARLEESHPDEEDAGILAVTTEVEAANVIAAYREAGRRPPLCIITGVPRPPERSSWETVLAHVAQNGRHVHDKSLQGQPVSSARIYREPT